MKTMFVYFFDLWRGPIMSNNETNKLFDHLLDDFNLSDILICGWYWGITDI